MNNFENDLTKGSVVNKLFRFSVPFILSNLIQSLYSVADLAIVSWFSGTAAVSGVNNGSQLSFLITNMVFGLCTGATVLIAQYLGAGEREKLKKTIGTLFTALFIVSIICTVVMIFLRVPLLRLINVPAEAFADAADYLLVTALGTVFIFGYNALSAVMRGLGDSKRPLVFVAIACVTNIVLDLLFVAVFKLGALGAAVATVISQAISMFLCVFYLARHNFIFDFKSLSSYKTSAHSLLTLIKVGLPTMIQNTATTFSFLFITAMANNFGLNESAAVGIVGKLNGFAILPAIAISAAISAMSAQNIGAGEIKRSVKTMLTGLIMSYSITAVVFALIQLFPSAILSLFGSEPGVISVGTEYLRVFSFDYIMVPLFFSINGIFIGSGHTVISLVTNMSSAILFRIPAAWYFGIYLNMGMKGLGFGAPAASLAASLIALVVFFTGIWKKPVIIKRDREL